MNNYFIVHKPFNVLSQFTTADDKKTLKYFFNVPPNVYPVGRLDYDSEGLLILTDDAYVNKHLLDPSYLHEKEYWAQVEGTITEDAANTMQKGVDININGKIYRTKNCFASIIKDPDVAERNPPIRFRKNVADSWMKIIITEGKNRQVRKMTAAIGFPTLRLIRYRIEKITIENILPGELKLLSRAEMYNLLQIKR